eukprot:Skav221681  [mRNA]  locus=scaffold1494:111724:114013:- [translate_table: standard]
MLRSPWELLSEVFPLCGDPHRTSVHMAHPRHDTSLRDHGDAAETELLGTHHGGHHDVPSSLDATVHS